MNTNKRIAFRGLNTGVRALVLILVLSGHSVGWADEVVADPHRFDKTIAEFEKADKENPPEQGKVLFLGSSSIRRWDTKAAFPGIDSMNRGFGGSQTSDAIFFFDRIVIPYQPSVIVLYEGDNDIGAGKSVEKVVSDLKTIFGLVKSRLEGTKLVYIPIKPSIKRDALWPKMAEVNQQIRKLSDKEPLLYYADIATPMLATGTPPSSDLFVEDGLHLSDKGYALWASVVQPVIEKALRKK